MNPLVLFGSRSSGPEGRNEYDNPLPPCPNSPNCIRTTIEVKDGVQNILTLSENLLHGMGVATIQPFPDEHRIKAVFNVLLFKDDFDLLAEASEPGLSLLHIRSASRTGYIDLGVNRRRVKRFIESLQKVAI